MKVEIPTMDTVEKRENGLAHMQRLLDAMGGSPDGWEWTGEVQEGDPNGMTPTKCACGHIIRWMYPWKHKDGLRSLITGSVCVDNLPGINAETVNLMREALNKLLAKRKEAQRKAKDASMTAEVVALREQLSALIEKDFGWALRIQGWKPPDAYYASMHAAYYRGELYRSKTLKTVRGQRDVLNRAIEALEKRQNESAGMKQ
jgi:hypothetical protein